VRDGNRVSFSTFIGSRRGVFEKSPKSRAEIETLLIADLRDVAGCEHVERIVVIPIPGDEDDANWTVKCFNRGRSNGATCDRALQEIVPRLQGFYELVQKH
jgi:hypothetical protein